jgi:Spy/CpxP family protein refolding chaperone
MPARCLMFALLGAMLVLSAGIAGQQDPKKDDPKAAKKDDPPTKLKGTLPANWKKLGLTDSQVQEVYRIQGKYNEEIDKLEAKIKDLKATRDKELKGVLTADQKKRLEEILVGKDRDAKKDK